MFKSVFHKISEGIRFYGFSYFIKLKITDLFYNIKFKNLQVDYTEGDVTSATLNQLSTNKDAKINQASPYFEIKKAFSFIGINFSDISLLDIGCGFGKVLNWGMILNFKHVIGIDLDQSAIDKANFNCNQLNKKGYLTKFQVISCDATNYNIPKDINVIYIANSFGKKTMQQVLQNIISHCIENSKELYLVYYLPIHQDLFYNYVECLKLHESFCRNKAEAEMAIFKIRKN
jgi:SAM-dependent methyltransferase